LKAGIEKKRFKTVTAWKETLLLLKKKSVPGAAGETSERTAKGQAAKAAKLPSGKFPGWKSIRSGETLPFVLLFVSLSGKVNLGSRLGEAAYAQVWKRLLQYLQQTLKEADALLWIENETNCLFLVPPNARYTEAAVTASLKTLIGAPMVAMETLGLSILPDFIFAMHYGKITYKAPGKTGTVVSDAVNFIYHLGAKHAETGRLTISGEVPEEAVPRRLDDVFTDAGEFEGRSIRHSRRFIYSPAGAP
jgi:hypothetical protein